MKSSFFILISCFLLINSSLFSQGKIGYIKKKSVTFHGATDTSDYLPILINTNHNVVIAGNNKINATQYDAITAAQSNNALSLWNNSFNSGNQKAFILSSVNDNGGNIITVGAIRTMSTNGLDWLVMKQNSGGSILWVYTYDGPGSYNDCATDVDVDLGGNIYVTGASDGTLTCLTDYATMMLSPTGTQQWISRYNYGNSFDIPSRINFNDASNNITVVGSSGTTFGNFEIATVVYDATSGMQLSTNRATNPAGSPQDKPFALRTDSLGNSYVVGTTFNGNNYDGYLIKLDTNLTPIWQKTVNINNFNDALTGVDIDDSLNVYVTGKSFFTSSNYNLITIKYHTNGNIAWYGLTENNPQINSEGLKIKVKSFDEIFVGGNIVNSGNQDICNTPLI